MMETANLYFWREKAEKKNKQLTKMWMRTRRSGVTPPACLRVAMGIHTQALIRVLKW